VLLEQTARLATVLDDAGVAPGDRVAIASQNDEPFVVAYLAALHAGAVAVPLNPAARPPSWRGSSRRCDRGGARRRPRGSGCAARPVPTFVRSISTRCRAELAPRVDRADDDQAVLLFTSGTAGTPKAAILTHGNLTSNIRQVLDHPGLTLTPSDVGLGTLPFFHIFGS
jgi:long-chain acyl-CoA synthetase